MRVHSVIDLCIRSPSERHPSAPAITRVPIQVHTIVKRNEHTITKPTEEEQDTPQTKHAPVDLLQLDSVGFTWDETAQKPPILSEINLTIQAGEWIAIVGPNGSGKTTLLRCLAGLLKPTTGSILLEGKPLSAYTRRELAQKIAVLSQVQEVETAMTVRELVQTGRYPYGRFWQKLRPEDEREVELAIQRVGLTDFATRRVDSLSGGERQRAFLAAAMAQATPILLLDEPMTYLDLAAQATFWDVLQHYRQERGITVIWVTHQLHSLADEACRVVGIRKGHCILDGSARKVLTPEGMMHLFGRPIGFQPADASHTMPPTATALSTSSLTEQSPHHSTQSQPPSCVAADSIRPKWPRGMTALGVLLLSLSAIGIAAWVGRPCLSLRAIFHPTDSLEFQLLTQFRLPRAMTAFCVGAVLSLAGLVFQALFRNPLATPYTLGVSSGAALGAVVALLFLIGTPLATGGAFVEVFSLLGALLSIGFVYGIYRLKRRANLSTLLLAGVGCNFLFSSLILLFQAICDPHQTLQTIYWMMGHIRADGFKHIGPLLMAFGVSGTLVGFWTRELDLLSLGDELAAARGVANQRIRTILFFVISWAVALVVSQCGPIGFVGMMVPHLCRLLFGPLHARLVPRVVVVGGLFLMICDTLARTIVFPVEIPVGIITALLGAPFLLYLLSREHTQS